mgnify:CR=1 FL=1
MKTKDLKKRAGYNNLVDSLYTELSKDGIHFFKYLTPPVESTTFKNYKVRSLHVNHLDVDYDEISENNRGRRQKEASAARDEFSGHRPMLSGIANSAPKPGSDFIGDFKAWGQLSTSKKFRIEMFVSL